MKVPTNFQLGVVVVVVVSLLIQLNPRAQNVSDHEVNRTVEVNETRESTPYCRGAAHAKVPGRGTYKCRLHASQNHEWVREDHAGPAESMEMHT